MPEKYSLCYICGNVARHACSMCGKHICDAHYDEKSRMCSSCKGGRRVDFHIKR